MKKLFYLFAVAVVAISLASCNKKDEPANKLVFEATLDASAGFYLEIYGMTEDEAWAIDWYVLGIQSYTATITDDNLYDPMLIKVKDGKKEAEYAVSDVNLNASMNADETVWTLVGTFTANDTQYDVEIKAALPDPHDGDEETAFAENFATYTVDTTYASQYHYLAVEATNDNAATVALGLYVPDTVITLVAGEYKIAETGAAMTATAGYASGQYIYPSFAAYITAQGYIEKVWYLVSGKVTVNADGSIVVAAVNSKGQQVNSTLTAPAPAAQGGEGADGAAAPAKKFARKLLKK